MSTDNWISVEKQMPEDYERVILYTKWNSCHFGKKEWKQGHNPDYWETDNGDLNMNDVTHWQPLPPPPNK